MSHEFIPDTQDEKTTLRTLQHRMRTKSLPTVAKWMVQVQDWRNDLGAVGKYEGLRPWTSLPGKRLTGVARTERAMNILDCVAIQALGGAEVAAALMQQQPETLRTWSITSALRDTLVDLSQNPQRRAFTNSAGISKCIHTSSILYSFGMDRILVPFEMMMLQGHSQGLRIPPQMSKASLQALAGMGVSLPCLGQILLAMMLTTGLSDYPSRR